MNTKNENMTDEEKEEAVKELVNCKRAICACLRDQANALSNRDVNPIRAFFTTQVALNVAYEENLYALAAARLISHAICDQLVNAFRQVKIDMVSALRAGLQGSPDATDSSKSVLH